MREGWEIKKAGDIFEMTDFVSNGSFASLRENVEYLDHPDYAVLVRLADYSNRFDSSKFVYVSKRSYEYLAKSKLYGGEIIMSNVGSVGKSFICPNLGCPMTIGPNAVLIRSKNNSFYQYYFQTEEFQQKLLSISSKATLLKFNKTNFKTLDIPVPSLAEQQRIVDILDREFAKIDALKANAEKSLQAAKDLFQASLKKELEPKEGWLNTTIGTLCESVKYGTSKPSSATGHYTYLRMNNITNDGFLSLADTKRIDITAEEEEKYLVRKGDILFNRTNSRELVGKSCVFQEDEPMVIAGYIIRLRLNDGINPCYVSYFINYEPVRAELRKLSVGAVHQSNINAKTIQSFKISIPSDKEEQDSIVDVLSNSFCKVSQLQKNHQKTISLCDDLKQSLLRKAFNGEL